ncbi:rRNA maturation RNase YbeY [Lentisphaerota bacterium WC36G]|nr:rRNA maturation RNase YbeY [Lentisphaerae bacterium WC36]
MTYSWNSEKYPQVNESELLTLFAEIKKLTLPDIPEEYGAHFIFVEDDEMVELNWQCLEHEGTTDVITFDYFNDDDDFFDEDSALEVIICLDFAKREGDERNDSSYAEELVLYIVHSMLHSAGFDDLCEEDRLEMRQQEARVMNALKRDGKLSQFNKVFPEPKMES